MDKRVNDEILDVDAVSKVFRVSVQTVKRLSKGGGLPPGKRVGKRLYWLRSDLERWVGATVPPRYEFDASKVSDAEMRLFSSEGVGGTGEVVRLHNETP